MEQLAPHGGCWWESCTTCNTERNPYPTSWKPTKLDKGESSMKIGDVVEWTNGMGFVMTGQRCEKTRNGNILRPMNAKVIKESKAEMQINDTNSVQLTAEQFTWVVNRNFRSSMGWDTSSNGMYQDNLDLKVQIWVKIDGSIEITNWS